MAKIIQSSPSQVQYIYAWPFGHCRQMMANSRFLGKKGAGGHVNYALGKRTPSSVQISPFINRAVRYLVSFSGGLLLLAPMYALLFIYTQSYQLITVTLFIIGFAILMAAITTRLNNKVIGATAAYATVLVVFLSQS